MLIYGLFGLLALFFLAAASGNWRQALLICVVVGFLQDPLRKLTPGEPVFLLVLVVAFVGLTLLIATQRTGGFRLRPVFGGSPLLFRSVNWFIALVCLQGFIAFLRTRSPIVAGIGLLAYLSPIPAIWLAFQYCRQPLDIERLLAWYGVISLAAAATIYLSWLGFDWPVLRPVGAGLDIYERTIGKYIDAHTGFLRTVENAAWHVGTGACFLLILAMSLRRRWLAIWVGPLVLFLIGAGLLTGRRKMLVEVVAFVAFYGLLALYFRQQTVTRAVLALMGGAFVFVLGSMTVVTEEVAADYNPYLSRGQTVFEDADERLLGVGLPSVVWALSRAGLFGYGAGVCSQGVQHFGSIGGCGAAEGGLGKIVLELGLPALLVAAVLVFALVRHGWRILVAIHRSYPELMGLAMGFSAFLLANASLFIVAAQIFGDPFVLLILGWCVGFLLAMPKLALAQTVAVMPQARPFTPSTEYG